MNIGVMLTEHNRGHLLAEQYLAVQSQTVKPVDIAVWRDRGLGTVGGDKIRSLGIWPRIVMSQFLNADFICIIDDDTIPGRRWLENCANTTAAIGMSLLGTCGQAFPDGSRENRRFVGWKVPAPVVIETDIVEHSWFFHRSLLSTIASAPIREFPTCGEQYWLSIEAKRRDWKVACPPHPKDNKEWWGSLKGMEYGDDETALWNDPKEEEKKTRLHNMFVAAGWKPSAATVMGDGNLGFEWHEAPWIGGPA